MAVIIDRRYGRRESTVGNTTTSTGRSFTGFLKAVATNDRYTLSRDYESHYVSGSGATVQKTAMGEGSGALGGYLIPQDYTLGLMNVISEESFIYPRADVWPMMAAEIKLPTIDVETLQSTGTSPYFGGVLFKWGSEQAPLETEPTFRQLSLKAWDLLGYAVVSNQLLEDTGPDGESALIRLFGRAAAHYAEYAFLQGLGTGQKMPLGIINSPALLTVTRRAAGQIGTSDIAAMTSNLLPYSWKRAIWTCSPSCMSQIVALSNFFLNQAAKQGELEQYAGSGAILSRPLFITESLPALGTQGDILLFDPSLYVIGNRQEVLIEASTHDAFKTNQTTFRVWLRLDGKPRLASTVRLIDGSDVVSAYVALSA
jgi:HK97 family phage major capsid protein